MLGGGTGCDCGLGIWASLILVVLRQERVLLSSDPIKHEEVHEYKVMHKNSRKPPF